MGRHRRRLPPRHRGERRRRNRSGARACCPTGTSAASRCSRRRVGRAWATRLLGRMIALALELGSPARDRQRPNACARFLRASRLCRVRSGVRRRGHSPSGDGARADIAGSSSLRCALDRGTSCATSPVAEPDRVEAALDEARVAALVDGHDGRATRSVLRADDEDRRQDALPLRRDAGRRQRRVARLLSVRQQLECRMRAGHRRARAPPPAPPCCAGPWAMACRANDSISRRCPRPSTRAPLARFDA